MNMDSKNKLGNESSLEVEKSVNDFSTSKSSDELGTFISRFFKILSIHKWLFTSVFAVVVLLLILYGLKQPTVYQSEYEVFYNETMREFVDEANVPFVKSDFDKNYWLRAMVSDELMEMTLKNSGLTYDKEEFKKMIEVGVMDKKKEDRIPVFRVQVSSKTREHIPFIIRAYIKSLNELLLINQVHNSERLVSYLTNQLNQNNGKLNQINLSITNGSSNTGEIIDFDKIKSSLDDFRKDLLNATVNLASIQSSRKRTETELKNLDGTIVNESAFSEPLKVQLMNLEVDLSRALTKNKEDHPAVKQIRQNIAQISAMLRDSIEQRLEIKSMIQNPIKSQLLAKLLELKIAEVSEETRVESLRKVIAELEKQTMPGSFNDAQQQQLRNREMITLTVKQLNDKLIETQSTSHGSLSRFVFIDDKNTIFLENRGLLYFIILGLLLGLVIAALIVFVYDLLDDRLMLVEDYEHFYRYPLLGVVRHYRANENYLISPSYDNNYRTVNDISGLIVNLRHIAKSKDIKTIVISSADRQEGKSLVSLKLASALANKKQKILLVDMDFYSPKLSNKLFAGNEVKGLSNYIVNDSTLEEIIQQTEVETLQFVTAGNADGQKELFYNDNNLYEFISWAKLNYDLVIFDTPAAMYIPDIIEFFEKMDSILVIARLRRTNRKVLDRLFKMTTNFNEKYIAVVLNDLYSGKGDNYDRNGYGYYASDYTNNSSKRDESEGQNSRIKRPKKSILFLILLFVVISVFVYLFYLKK
jgi:capsular exopolysaccharide synthesis family protein